MLIGQRAAAPTWPWAAAAAVLLAAIASFELATSRLARALPVRAATAERAAAVADLATMLGGDDEAAAAAERIVATQEIERRVESLRQPASTAGEVR